MRKTVILAGSLREANAYCRDKGIRAVFAQSSAQVRSADHIIELPGFSQRRDKFAMAASRDARLKYGKGVTYVEESDWVAPKWRTADSPDEEYAMIDDEIEPGGDTIPVTPELDLTDDRTLLELKARLNAVGWTLKKLPAKKPIDRSAVPAPVEF